MNSNKSETFTITEKPLTKTPATFTAPIYVPPSPPKSAYLPPDSMQMPSVPGSHFLPTIPPEKTPYNNLLTDLHAFPSHVNSSFLPPELDSIKNSIDSYTSEQTTVDYSNEETTYSQSSIYNFPPNVDSAYSPPPTRIKSPTNSYLPIPSGDDSKTVDDSGSDDAFEAPEELDRFPPNFASAYPKTMNSIALGNSYLSPPSGDKDAETLDESQKTDEMAAYIPPNNLFNFPPNIGSNYLPPQVGSSYSTPFSGSGNGIDNSQAPQFPTFASSALPPQNPFNFPPNIESSYLPAEMRQVKQSVNSYLPPASGSVSGFYEGSKATITDAPQMDVMAAMDMAPPDEMMDMAPPSNDDDHHHHHHSDHPPW